MIAKLRQLIKTFSKSTMGTTELGIQRFEDGVARSLRKIGKTRFATVYWSAVAVQGCLPQLRRTVTLGKVTFSKVTGIHSRSNLYSPRLQEVDISFLRSDTAATLRFQGSMTQYTSVLAPIAHAIKALEATNAPSWPDGNGVVGRLGAPCARTNSCRMLP